MSDTIRPRLELDHGHMAARALAAQIINLTHAYLREARDIGDYRGARAREDMWREEIMRACLESHKATGAALDKTRQQLTAILAEYLRPEYVRFDGALMTSDVGIAACPPADKILRACVHCGKALELMPSVADGHQGNVFACPGGCDGVVVSFGPGVRVSL